MTGWAKPMAERLFITSWNIDRWGRASGSVSQTLSDGLTVVYGPNASGKSSVAMALAWLIAGPGTRLSVQRLGDPEEDLCAELTASLGESTVNLGVRATIPLSRNQEPLKEDFTGDIDGDNIERADLSNRLGVITFETFGRYYWVDSLGLGATREATADGGADRSLTIRSVFGGRDPFEIAQQLNEDGYDIIGRTRGRAAAGSARKIAEGIREQKKLIRTAGHSEAAREEAEEKLREIDENLHTKRSEREASSKTVSVLERTIAARPQHTAWLAAENKLEDTPVPSDEDHGLATSRVEVAQAIQDLNTSKTAVSEAKEQLKRRRTNCRDGWGNLIDSIDAKPARIAAVGTAEATLARRHEDRAEAAAKGGTAGRVVNGTDPSGPTGSTGRAGQLAIYGTALGLTTATIISAVLGGTISTVVLGLIAAITLVPALWRRSDTHARVVDPEGNLEEAEELVKTATARRNGLLNDAGVPDTLISDDFCAHNVDLQAVADAQSAEIDLNDAASRGDTRLSDLLTSFPDGTLADRTTGLLAAAIERVDSYKEAKDARDRLALALWQSVGGENTPEQQFLTDRSDVELEALLRAEEETHAPLDQAVADLEDERATTQVNIERLIQEADPQTPELEHKRLVAEVRDLAVRGLAHRLASRVIKDVADEFLGDNGPQLLTRALELCHAVAPRWIELRLDPRSDRLLVRDSNGEHAERALSTGDLTNLNLALRLATIESSAVTLPIFLDDALIHFDNGREEAAIAMLREIAQGHQVIYFTCRDDLAALVEGQGGNRIDLEDLYR